MHVEPGLTHAVSGLEFPPQNADLDLGALLHVLSELESFVPSVPYSTELRQNLSYVLQINALIHIDQGVRCVE